MREQLIDDEDDPILKDTPRKINLIDIPPTYENYLQLSNKSGRVSNFSADNLDSYQDGANDFNLLKSNDSACNDFNENIWTLQKLL